jgi:c(7)-type cytochrome triheme protein
VDWNKALLGGHIDPRTNVHPETKIQVLDLDVIMKRTGEMPMVRFPHRQHTMWLDCTNCHDHLFKTKAGTSNVNMMQILSGEKCGLCHGAVAFPLTECQRCHSLPRKKQ